MCYGRVLPGGEPPARPLPENAPVQAPPDDEFRPFSATNRDFPGALLAPEEQVALR